MNAMLGFQNQVVVSSVDADIVDPVHGMATVKLVGGSVRLTVRDWGGVPPRIGDTFTLTVEAAS